MYQASINTVVYVPQQILQKSIDERVTFEDLSIIRRYIRKSSKSKSKNLSMILSFSINRDYKDSLIYEIYVNNTIRGHSKTLFGIVPPNLDIKNGIKSNYYGFHHRRFDQDTIRLVIANKKKTETLIDISFIVDEQDSIPQDSRRLSFDNQTDKIVYVSIAGRRNQSRELTYIKDLPTPPNWTNTTIIRPNLISPLLWSDFIKENFDLYVVVFPNKDEMDKWKCNPQYMAPFPTYNLSMKELDQKRNLYRITYTNNDEKEVLIESNKRQEP